MKLQPSITINRKRGTKVVTMLGEKDIEAIKRGEKSLSKRAVLSFLMGNFDPLGLLTPLIVRGKILLRRLYGPDCSLDWDDPLPREEKEVWCDLLQLAVEMKPIPFLRTVMPSSARGRAWLVGFGDGSLAAFATALYVRWRVGPPEGPPFGPPDGPPDGPPAENTNYWVNLLLAKARVSPVHGTSTPRAEMQSLIMMMRLILTAVKSLPFKVERVVVALDSQCSIAATEKSGGLLGPYFANRVNEYYQLRGEIEELVDFAEPLQHVPGELNVSADMCTRGRAKADDLRPDSPWQGGPAFLRLERDQWPLCRDFRSVSLPKEELRSKHEVLFFKSKTPQTEHAMETMKDLVLKNLNHHSSWTKSLGVLARLVRSLSCFNPLMSVQERRALVAKDPDANELEVARKLQMMFSQPESIKALKEGRLTTLGGRIECGLVVVSGRVPEDDLGAILGKPYLPVIWATTPLARLIVRHCHQEDHRLSPSDVVARTRRLVWIPRCTALAKSEARSCLYCRRKRKSLVQQVMGSLPEGQAKPSVPFLATCLDLFGPVVCRGLGGGVRRPMKAYGVVFCCLSTRAIKILATTGYSTEQFLVCYRKFTSNQGSPATILSDHGTQLLSAASRVMDPQARDLDWEKIVGLSSRSGTRLIFSEKGCPWKNGSAEATVKLAKETLAHQLQSHQSLDWSELDSLFCQVADIINNRPLGVFHAEDDYHQICPNDLLLGRTHHINSEPDLPEGDVDPKSVLTDRELLVRRWWKEWERKVFPTLLPRQKWHQQHRNVVPGDIVLIQYKTKVTTVWKLGRVSEVFPDKHGVVRTCEVVFRPKHRGEKLLPYKSKSVYSLRIAVQRLCVLLPVEEQGEPDIVDGGQVAADAQDVLAEKDSPEQLPEEPDVSTCLVPVDASVEDWEKVYPRDEVRSLEERVEGYDDRGPKRMSRREKVKRTKEVQEPRRFSRRLAGFSAAVKVALDLEFYLSSEDDDCEDTDLM